MSAAAALGLGGPQQSAPTPSPTSHHSSIEPHLANPGAGGEEEEGTLPKGKPSPWWSRPSPRRPCQPLPAPANPCQALHLGTSHHPASQAASGSLNP